MTKYILLDAVLAEIEKLMNRYDSEYDEDSTEVKAAKGNVCHEILCTINSLEVKEVDLEKAIDDYIYTHDGRKRLALELDWKYCNLTLKGGDEIIKFAKHFFELGLKAQKGEKV